MTLPPGSRLDRLCTALALAGGGLLCLVIGAQVVSVLGRSLPELLAWTGLAVRPRPLPGDDEISRALTAVALFAVLPYCQLRRAHIRIEIFSGWFPPTLNRRLDLLWSAAMAVLAGLMFWRLGLGFLAKLDNGGTSMVLAIPDWLPFGVAVALMGATFAASVTLALQDAIRP